MSRSQGLANARISSSPLGGDSRAVAVGVDGRTVGITYIGGDGGEEVGYSTSGRALVLVHRLAPSKAIALLDKNRILIESCGFRSDSK